MLVLVTLPKVVVNPLWGRMSDRRGRRPVFTVLMGGSMAGSALWALSPTLGALVGSGLVWLAVSRAVVGVFSAQATLAYAVASDSTLPERRASAMGMLGAAFGLGMIVGIPLGSFVGQYSLPSVGWLCMSFELVALLVVAMVLRETHRPTGAEFTPAARDLLRLVRLPVVVNLLVVTVLVTLGLSVMMPTFPKLTADWYGFEVMTTGWVMTVWGIVGVAVQGGSIRPVVGRIGEKATTAIGSIVLAGGFIWLALHPGVGGLWAATVVIAAGAGLMIPSLTGLLSRQVGSADQGGIHGLSQSATALGRAIGYFTGGVLYAAISPGTPYLVGAAAILAGLLPLAMLSQRLPRRDPGAPANVSDAVDPR
jgi:MFS family permease